MAGPFPKCLAGLGFLAGLLTPLAWSLTAHGDDLLEVYHLAQVNDPTFESARHALDAAREKEPQALAGLLPVLAVTGNENVSHFQASYSNSVTVPRDIRAWTWSLQLTQPLLRAQSLYAYFESESYVAQAAAKFVQSEQDLILRVAQPYFDVLAAQESIAVVEAQLRAMEEQLTFAKHGYEAGAHAITDVYEAQSRIDLARAQWVAARNEREIKRAELEKIIGETLGSLSGLKTDMVAPRPEPRDPRPWMEQARENNPAVLAPLAALEAAETEVKRNRAEYLPTLDLVASYGGNYSSGSVYPSDYSTTSNTKQAGLQLSLPLYSGGATDSRVAEAIANRNKAGADLEAARRQAATDARQAYAGVVNGLSQVEALVSAVESSKSAVKGAQAGYRLGIKMNIDVLNAEHQLYTAQRDLAKARYDTLFQGLKLKAAAGVLSETDLAAINKSLVAPVSR